MHKVEGKWIHKWTFFFIKSGLVKLQDIVEVQVLHQLCLRQKAEHCLYIGSCSENKDHRGKFDFKHPHASNNRVSECKDGTNIYLFKKMYKDKIIRQCQVCCLFIYFTFCFGCGWWVVVYALLYKEKKLYCILHKWQLNVSDGQTITCDWMWIIVSMIRNEMKCLWRSESLRRRETMWDREKKGKAHL